MKIQQTSQSFNGIKIATAKAKLGSSVADYSLYKVTKKDSEYLADLVSKIDLSKLYPGLETSKYKLWRDDMNSLINYISTRSMETIMIAKDGILCGGLNYAKKTNNTCDIGYRVTWPAKKGKKAPFAGKILYMHLFKFCLDSGIRSIRTVVTRCGAFDAITKCCELGFGFAGGDNFSEVMTIGPKSMSATLNKFDNFVEINRVPESKQVDVDLSKEFKEISI